MSWGSLQRWAAAALLATRSAPMAGTSASQRKHARLVAGSGNESQQLGRREPRGCGVLERMAIDLGEIHQRLVDHDRDIRGALVDERERRYRASRHAEHGFEQLRLA